MAIARSRLTARCRISVPAEVRKLLGLGPGSVVEWSVEGERLVVLHAGRHSLDDTRSALGFTELLPRRSIAELREDIQRNVKTRHARR